VSAGGKVYGAPWAGFRRAHPVQPKVWSDLGLQVPTTWAEFMLNNAKIKAAGKDPVIQSYQTTWTSQLFGLGDFQRVRQPAGRA
jgi:raffinose/stachyose/melibiose transport system substrate-binding protein